MTAGRSGALAGREVLLGVSGGIAAYKAASLARALVKSGAQVQAVLTAGAAEFVGPATFEGLTGRRAYTGVFEDVHDIVHVRLARRADVAVIAPATANVLAKFATGIADDLLSSTFTCLTCPVVIAPAMHTEMWLHPANQANVATLAARGARIVGPGEGELAGGDVGPGRLVDEDVLLDAVISAVRPEGPLAGRRVVVTAGGTREPIDPVRFIGNRSSGRMGYAIAEAAARRGAVVDLVTAPTALDDPPATRLHRVETAQQMHDTVLELAAGADVVVKAAAVADFRPATAAAQKIKKDGGGLDVVPLERNPDILAALGADKGGRILVGFAAETEDEVAHGRDKLARKSLDLIVVNRVDTPDAGFDTETNRAVLIAADGPVEEVGLVPKRDLADRILDRVEQLLTARGA